MMRIFFRSIHCLSILVCCLGLATVAATGQAVDTLRLLNHQGRMAVDGINFNGTGHFKFALLNGAGDLVWSNAELVADAQTNESAPASAVDLTVSKGLYSVLLGDASLPHMASIPAAVFDNRNLTLRVWFDDGTHGFQKISPDQRLASVPFAVVAEKAQSSVNFSGELAGDVKGPQGATSIAASTITGKTLDGFSSAAGSLLATDSILSAIGKLDGNVALKASLASPSFTGTVSGITKSMVGLGSVDNTSDASKPVSTAQQTALNLKANLASPTFTGTVGGITKAMVGLGSVDNTADASKPVSSAQQTALNLKADLASPTFTGTVAGITKSMVGLGNVNNTSDASKPVSSAQQTALDLKADLASPTFTGTVSGITKSMVGLGSANNTSDANKPVSTAQQTALDLKADLASPTFTGTVSGITASMVGLGSVNNTSDANKPVSTAQQTALNLKANLASPTFTGSVQLPAGTVSAAPLKLATGANLTSPVFGAVEFDGTNLYLTNNSASPVRRTVAFTDSPVSTAQQAALDLKADLASPTFTGTVGGITKAMVGLGSVDNTSDANKPVSTAQQTALNLKANLASPTFTGSVSGITAAMVGLGNVTNTSDANKPVSTAQQTALDLKANLASPTFTGTVGGITKSMVGLGSVDNTSDASKPVSSAQQTALNLKANLASPTFTGTVSGITASMVGLGNVDNTSDASKPVSSAQQTALNLKANLASPTFTGSVQLPAGTVTAAPLKLATGTNLTNPVFGAVEFDGTNLYLTNNSVSPARKTVAFTDTPVSLGNITAAPVLPVLAWGKNNSGQTTVPALANVAAVAAGESHSLALLDGGTVVTWGNGTAVPGSLNSVTAIAAGSLHDLAVKSDGTVIAWGDNTYGQTTVPPGIGNATQAAAGEKHSLVLRSTGAVTSWGDNSFGQITVPAAALSGVISIAAGYDHSLALKSDGTVVAWGRNDAGQTTVPAGLTNVIAIAAGAYHSLALKSDGTVVAWGWDNGGQSTVPAGLARVTKITGGYAFSAALKDDGSIVAWGDNTSGQCSVPSGATQITHFAAGASHMMALRADAIPAQVARLDQDNVFTGKVGIKRTPVVNALEVEGSASKTTASSWLANSDRRIKTDIETLTGALDKIDRVRLVDFRYTDEYQAAHPAIEDRRYLNVIAQEFAEVFPEHVKESGEFLADGSPILQVDTYPLTICSAAAIQDLHRENQALKQRITDQEARLRKLEALLEKH